MAGNTVQQLSKIYLKHCRFESLPAVSEQRCLYIQCFLQGALGGNGNRRKENENENKLDEGQSTFVCMRKPEPSITTWNCTFVSIVQDQFLFFVIGCGTHIACIRNETSHFLCVWHKLSCLETSNAHAKRVCGTGSGDTSARQIRCRCSCHTVVFGPDSFVRLCVQISASYQS